METNKTSTTPQRLSVNMRQIVTVSILTKSQEKEEYTAELYDVENNVYIILYKKEGEQFITIPFAWIEKITLSINEKVIYERNTT